MHANTFNNPASREAEGSDSVRDAATRAQEMRVLRPPSPRGHSLVLGQQAGPNINRVSPAVRPVPAAVEHITNPRLLSGTHQTPESGGQSAPSVRVPGDMEPLTPRYPEIQKLSESSLDRRWYENKVSQLQEAERNRMRHGLRSEAEITQDGRRAQDELSTTIVARGGPFKVNIARMVSDDKNIERKMNTLKAELTVKGRQSGPRPGLTPDALIGRAMQVATGEIFKARADYVATWREEGQIDGSGLLPGPAAQAAQAQPKDGVVGWSVLGQGHVVMNKVPEPPAGLLDFYTVRIGGPRDFDESRPYGNRLKQIDIETVTDPDSLFIVEKLMLQFPDFWRNHIYPDSYRDGTTPVLHTRSNYKPEADGRPMGLHRNGQGLEKNMFDFWAGDPVAQRLQRELAGENGMLIGNRNIEFVDIWYEIDVYGNSKLRYTIVLEDLPGNAPRYEDVAAGQAGIILL